jgi:thiamine pyrophosphate-dependent acetolactate synthase large subunit-like protein
MANPGDGLDRRAAVSAILRGREDALVVTGLGSSSFDAGVHDDPRTFYLWGGMGAAAMMGLGLALAQPSRRILVITGDGEMLMALGALATIGAEQPRNLAIVVLDNEVYGETGMQPTHTQRGVDLPGIARACSFPMAETVRCGQELASVVARLYAEPGPLFVDIKVTATHYPLSLRLRDGAHIKNRFREALLGSKAFD